MLHFVGKKNVSCLRLGKRFFSLENDDRSYYKYWKIMNTRWNDNDMYGHVNNIIYYSFFDTIINQYLIEEANFDINSKTNVIGYCISSNCNFKKPITYPQIINAGLSIEKIGKTSVIYNVGIFADNENNKANAYGNFVHCFVDQVSQTKADIPLQIRKAFEKILINN